MRRFCCFWKSFVDGGICYLLIISHSHKACKKITKKVEKKFGGFMQNPYLCSGIPSMKNMAAWGRGFLDDECAVDG